MASYLYRKCTSDSSDSYISVLLYLGHFRVIRLKTKLNSTPEWFSLNANREIFMYVLSASQFNLLRDNIFPFSYADEIPHDIDLSTMNDSLNINLIGGSLPESIETSRTAVSRCWCWESALKVRFRSCADSSTNQVSYD